MTYEILGWGQEEPSFDNTRHSHSSCCDRVNHHRAAHANARSLLGSDRNFDRHPIHVRRDTNAVDRRIVATAVGASVGALEANYFGANLVAFAVAIFLVGLLSIASRLEKTAYHYASITLTIIVLIPRPAAPWIVALNRFLEVSVGIIVALAVVALWPEQRRLSPNSAAE